MGDLMPWVSATAKGDPDHRRMFLFQQARIFFAVLEGASPGAHVFCEEPLALAKNGKTTRLLGLAAGAIWSAHLEFDLFWHWVDVATWKKEIIGAGNASKTDIAAWWHATYATRVEPARFHAYKAEADYMDAHALMLYGRSALSSLSATEGDS